MRRAVISLIVTLFVLPVAASASSPLETLVTFNPAAGEFPEGVAIDKTGNIYMSVTPLGQIRTFAPDGSQSLLTTLPATGVFGPTGLAVDSPGNVYAADVTFDPATRGVYRIARDGTSVRLPGTGGIQFANGLAFDQRGNLYVTDSILGAVWRIPRGGTAEIWAQGQLLAGNGSFGFGFPIGANGIAYRNGDMFVANTEGAKIVRIPVQPNGAAGTPQMVVQGSALFGADGLALDVHGNLFVAVSGQSTLLRVGATDGQIATLATGADGLDGDSSLAFGTGRGDREALFLANFAFFGPPATAHPALLKFQAGVPGMPLP
jgi:sugar lactone lactonase YvrE